MTGTEEREPGGAGVPRGPGGPIEAGGPFGTGEPIGTGGTAPPSAGPASPAPPSAPAATAPASSAGPGRTLFAFVRHWARRWNGPGDEHAARQGRLVLATEAVLALADRGPATVNAVAREIGIDQSGASRLVKEAADAGYLELRASAADARRREAAVTDAGLALLEEAHRWQEAMFDRLTEHWTDGERAEFHRAMHRLIDRSHTLDA